jgi:hypothetical protein
LRWQDKPYVQDILSHPMPMLSNEPLEHRLWSVTTVESGSETNLYARSERKPRTRFVSTTTHRELPVVSHLLSMWPGDDRACPAFVEPGYVLQRDALSFPGAAYDEHAGLTGTYLLLPSTGRMPDLPFLQRAGRKG